MNCNEFAKIINDLACYNLMDAGKKEQALLHTNVCVQCAARLSYERNLSNSLCLASSAETEQAPSHVKTNLLAAFKEQSKATTTVFAPVYKTKNLSYFWKWGVAMAAVFVIALLGLAVMRFVFQQKPQLQQAANVPVEVKEDPIQNNDKDKQEIRKTSPLTPIQKNKVNNVHRSYAAKSPRRKLNVPSNESAKNEEVTSDFIALTYAGETSSTGNNRMIVRVNVPRATLIAMGLPLNAAQTEGYVKADLVVGDDGVAHAIRLVQDSSQTSETKEKTN